MALTRARLRELGITEKEVLDEIMEGHGTGVEAAKEKAKEDAEKAAKIKIDALQAKVDSIPEPPSDGEDWKTKYENLAASAIGEDGKTYKELHDALKDEYEKYKSDKEKESKLRKLEKVLSDQYNASAKYAPKIAKDFPIDELEDDGDTFKNFDKYLEKVKPSWEDMFGTVQTIGSGIATPPKGNGSIKNPFLRENFSLEAQTKLFRENPKLARDMAAAAGIKI